MIEKVASMFRPDTEMTTRYAQQVAECAMRLARSQLEVTENIYSEVSREYRELLATEEPSAMLRNWPKVLENTTRTGTEGMATLLKNAVDYRNELIQLMQSLAPELNGQIFERPIKTSRTAGIRTDAPVGRAPRQSSGGANGPRASRAA